MRRDGGECRMSDLPNDILISIISRLTLREAMATSILSRRWRYLHTYAARLDFPRFTPEVQMIGVMKRISIAGHAKLRHVGIDGVRKVEAVEIRDLVSLVILGLQCLSDTCVIELQGVPNLTQLHTSELGGITHPYLFSRIQSCICRQLQLLHVSSPDFCRRGDDPWEPLPDYGFVNVKHLVLQVTSMSKLAGFDQLYHLIRTCPSLEKLRIKFVWSKYGLPKKFGERKAVDHENHQKLLPNLKEVEMEGYAGCRSEFKIASYIINHAHNLERLIVVACDATNNIRKKSILRAQQDFIGRRPPPFGLQII